MAVDGELLLNPDNVDMPFDGVVDISMLPEINHAGDLDALLGDLALMGGIQFEQVGRPNLARTVLGHMDLYICSARRLTTDPVGMVPGLSEKLHFYGDVYAQVDGGPEVPRGTIQTYARNGSPTITGMPEEVTFINELAKTQEAMDSSLESLASIVFADASFETIESVLLQAASAVGTMKDSMVTVKRSFGKQPKGFFAKELRPYFDEVPIDGEKWDSPGAGQLSFTGLMHLLHGCDSPSELARSFYAHNEVYLKISQRAAIQSFISTNKSSFFTFIRNLPSGDTRDRLEAAYLSIFEEATEFGKIHVANAWNDFRFRPKDARGGAGYAPDNLDELQDGRYLVVGNIARDPNTLSWHARIALLANKYASIVPRWGKERMESGISATLYTNGAGCVLRDVDRGRERNPELPTTLYGYHVSVLRPAFSSEAAKIVALGLPESETMNGIWSIAPVVKVYDERAGRFIETMGPRSYAHYNGSAWQVARERADVSEDTPFADRLEDWSSELSIPERRAIAHIAERTEFAVDLVCLMKDEYNLLDGIQTAIRSRVRWRGGEEALAQHDTLYNWKHEDDTPREVFRHFSDAYELAPLYSIYGNMTSGIPGLGNYTRETIGYPALKALQQGKSTAVEEGLIPTYEKVF